MPLRSPTFRRFLDLQPEDILVDFQIHTTQTDGRHEAGEILDVAAKRGLRAVAFTEHVRRGTSWFPGFAADIRQAADERAELTVYVGCEAKALDTKGGFDADPDLLRQCEIVLGSVHRFPNGKGGFLDFDALSAEETARIELELALGLVRSAPIDVLAHPGGMYQRRHGAFPLPMFRQLAEATLAHGVALEINSSYLVEPDPFLRLCSELNPIVSIGSDVHDIDEVGQCRDLLANWFSW